MNQPHTPPHVHLDDQPIKAFWCWTKKSKEQQPLQLYSWTVNLEWLVTDTKALTQSLWFPWNSEGKHFPSLTGFWVSIPSSGLYYFQPPH